MNYMAETLWPPRVAARSAVEGRLFRVDALRRGQARVGVVAAMAAGAGLGLIYFVPFRLMMRMLTEEPTFTFWGNFALAIYCALIGGLSGLLYAGRQRGWRRRSRMAPAILLVTLLSFFLIFATPVPFMEGFAFLAVEMTGWRARTRKIMVGLAAVSTVILWVVVYWLTPGYYGPVVDAAGLLLIIPLSAVRLIPFGLAVTKLRESERRAPREYAAPAGALSPAL
jgi:hypothetical protein